MIKIITVGQIKEKYLQDAINEYKKRLSKYTKLRKKILTNFKTVKTTCSLEKIFGGKYEENNFKFNDSFYIIKLCKWN